MKNKNKLNEAVDLLSKMIEIQSFSREEDRVADLIYRYLAERADSVERIGNNIILRNTKHLKSKPTLLLNSHIDTVKPGSTWTKDPYCPTIIDGKLYGLGSNDAGASLVCLLFTALELIDKQNYNVIFCASAEEEISGENGIVKALESLPSIDLAIVGEPTNMEPAVAEKGLMVLDGTSIGKSGHAARNEGINAINLTLCDLEWFRTYKFKKVSPFLGEVKMSVTQINAGTQHNVVPDRCTFVVDVRGNGCYTNQELLDIIQKNTKAEIKPRSTRLNSSMLDLEHPIFDRFKDLGMKPYGSPTLSDQALMPFNSIKIGPGFSGRSHTADEYIELKEIEDALVRYIELLDNLKF